MQLLNGFVVLDANEVLALDDLGGGRFPYSSAKPEKLYRDLAAWQNEALATQHENDQIRMLGKGMIIGFSARMIEELSLLTGGTLETVSSGDVERYIGSD